MLRLFRIKSSVKTEARLKSEPREILIDHDGQAYRVVLKRVAAARRYTLRVRPATQDLVLTMPMRGSLHAARDFAERHAEWIGQKMRRLPESVPFAPGVTIPLRGTDHLIVHLPQARGTVKALCVDGVWQLHVAGDSAHMARRIRDYLRAEARKDLIVAVERHSSALNIPVRSLTLKDTTSRWGSCSSRGALNFSWRLIFAPAHVLDYLAAHEVAHLRHLDHSPQFWKLTRQLCPGTDAAEAWLKRHGSGLHRYGKH